MGVTTEAAFESNIEAHLLASGWSKLDPSSYDRKLGLFADDLAGLVQESQPKAWAQLVTKSGGPQHAASKLAVTVAEAIDHRGTVSVLRDPVKVLGTPVRLCYFKPASGLNDEQLQRYSKNRTAVVRQLHHSETRPADSLDLCLVVNGIPVATAELKNPLTHQNVENAMAQYRADRNPHDLMFRARTLVHFAVDPHAVMMTTKLAGDATRFLPFNQGSAGAGKPGAAGNPPSTGGYQTAYLWELVWQRDAWLDLLGSFIHVGDGGTVLFPRFHQWHAVRSILAATYADGAGVDRLIQHSAGSGKSNTIAWTAHALSRLHGPDDQPIFDKVVVITDRKVLDRQLQDTVAGLEHTPGTIVRVDQKSDQLKDALQGNAARVIITTLQKFPVVAKLAKEDAAAGEGKDVVGRRFAVIVDEAHSSTTGDGVSTMKKVLKGQSALEEAEAVEAAEEETTPDEALLESARSRGKARNLSFFAFTATPKPKTLDTFGQLDADGHMRPFHTYSMRQAIDEGFILDVLANYTTYSTYYKLANSHPRNDPEMDASKAKSVLAQYVSLHPYQLDEKAKVIVEHFRAKTAPKIDGRAKAMVVTRSRLHAVRMHQALQGYIKRKGYDTGEHPLRTLVAFSGTVTDPDDPSLTFTEAGINGFSEGQLPKQFKSDDYQVLVVAEKYQTGFDEPLLHTMYVDKKLSGVKAVQTLSRLNRTHPGKDDTFVLDFANSSEEIKSSFAPFFEESFALPTEPQLLYTLEHDLMAAGVLSVPEMDASVAALFSGDDAQQPAIYTNVGFAVGRFVALDEDSQESFRGTLTHFCRAYAFVAQIMPWHDAELERLFLYGRLLLADLPPRENDPMPQISKSVQLTHLRIAMTSDAAIELEASDEPGVALPGEGKGSAQEPVMDKLSALISAMNDRYGADLGEADKVWVQQQWVVVKADDELRAIAQNNERSAYDDELLKKVKDLIVDRHDKNGVLFDMFFANPDFQVRLVNYLAGTYDEFREEPAG